MGTWMDSSYVHTRRSNTYFDIEKGRPHMKREKNMTHDGLDRAGRQIDTPTRRKYICKAKQSNLGRKKE